MRDIDYRIKALEDRLNRKSIELVSGLHGIDHGSVPRRLAEAIASIAKTLKIDAVPLAEAENNPTIWIRNIGLYRKVLDKFRKMRS